MKKLYGLALIVLMVSCNNAADVTTVDSDHTSTGDTAATTDSAKVVDTFSKPRTDGTKTKEQ